MDKLLFFLLQNKAHRERYGTSTTELAESTGMSQQNVSRLLIELEKQGKIERNKNGITVTKKGVEEGKKEYLMLKKIFEEKGIRIKGKIVEGSKQGGYYLSFPEYKKEIKKKLGFDPYPGTLNVKLEEKEMEKRDFILEKEPIIINGFKTKERTYGEIYSYWGKIEGGKIVIVFPLRSHYGKDIIEIIDSKNLKKKLGKKTGDEILIEI